MNGAVIGQARPVATDQTIIADRIASTDGVELQSYDFGGDGPLLVMCHATGFCGAMWEPVARILTSEYRCVALDFRAHGLSTPPEHGHMRWTGMAADIGAIVDHYGDGGPIRAVGHSLGGGSLVLAERSRPGTICAAWSFEPILFGPPAANEEPAPSEMSERARARRSGFSSRREAFDRYRHRPPLDILDERCLRAYVDFGFVDDDGRVSLACTPEYEARVFEQHRTGADAEALKLTIPWVMAIGGRPDVVTDAVETVTAANEHLQLIRYDELSHFGPLEAPDRLADDMLKWFTAQG